MDLKNTLAIALILVGGVLVYSGFKNWTLGETLKFFAGQDPPSDYTPMTEQEKEDLSNLTWGNGQAPGTQKGPLPDAKNFDVLPEIMGLPPIPKPGA